MTTVFAVAGIIFYLAAAFLLMGKIVNQQTPNKKLAMILSLAGAAAHICYLSQAIVIAPGQNMSITNVLPLVSWLITVSMLISASVMPNIILLPVVFGFSAMTIAAAQVLPVSHIMHIEMQPGLVIHITLSLFAYGTLVIAFLYALQMSFITFKLKQKGASLLNSPLPPLMLVEGMLFKLLLVGTFLLILSLVSGFVFLDNMFSTMYAHKTVLSIIALAVYIVLLTGQHIWGWRGKQVIVLTVIGLMLLTLAYFGSRFVREILL